MSEAIVSRHSPRHAVAPFSGSLSDRLVHLLHPEDYAECSIVLFSSAFSPPKRPTLGPSLKSDDATPTGTWVGDNFQ